MVSIQTVGISLLFDSVLLAKTHKVDHKSDNNRHLAKVNAVYYEPNVGPDVQSPGF